MLRAPAPYLIVVKPNLGVSSIAKLAKAGRKPWVRMNQGQTRAFGPSERPAPGAPSLIEVLNPPQRRSIVKKFNPRGRVAVPQAAGESAIILSFRVPTSFSYSLDGFTVGLGPSSIYAGNYIWRFFVNGVDILNDGSDQPFPGLPAQAGVFMPLGMQTSEKFVAMPGTLIEAVLTALNPIAATDETSFALFGSLLGEG